MKWNIYYSDGTTLSSEAATPSSIVKRVGVQVIIQEDNEKGWIAVSGYDYFMWDARGGDAKWFRGDDAGLFQYLTQPGSKFVLLGEWVDDVAYREILQRANKDRTFANKSGFAPWERKP